MSKGSFKYIIQKPKITNGLSPLLLMVHGYGSNENDLFSFSKSLPNNLTIISIRGDIETFGMGYAWYDISIDHLGNKKYDNIKAIESRDQIHNFIKDCPKYFNTDPNNVTLMGFSQGAILVNSVALTFPESIRNIISLSGGVDKTIINLANKSFDHLSFYFSHGSQDEILPYDLAKDSLDFLDQNKIIYDFETYPVGHGVCPENFESMVVWFRNKLQ